MNKSHHILQHLPYLAAIARTHSFTRAAELLSVTQSAVSYQIKQIEEKTGARMVVRQSGSRISLTSAGKALASEYATMAHRLDLTLEGLGAECPAGRLRLTVPVDFGSQILPATLSHLETLAPKLEVELIVSDTIADLKRDMIDFAIRSVPMDDTLIHRPLVRTVKMVVASPDYLARHEAPATAAALAVHKLLIRGPDQSPSWQALLATAGLTLADIPSRQALGNSFAMAAGARAGLGLALLPRFLLADDLATGRLIEVPMVGLEDMDTHFYLSFLPLPQLRPRADILEKAVRQAMEADIYGDCFSMLKN